MFKNVIIDILKYFDDKPLVKHVYTEIHNLRSKHIFNKNQFYCFESKDGIFIGVYDPDSHPTWSQMSMGSFEVQETNLIKELIPSMSCFIDIGAHIGIYSCLVSRQKPIPIYIFEPNSTNIASLKKNLEINKVKKAQLFKTGLSDKRQIVKMYGGDAMGSVVKNSFKNVPAASQLIKLRKLDEFIDTIPMTKNMVIKIDVEGHEYQVVLGAKKFIINHKPSYVLVEIVRYWGGMENPRFLDTFKLFSDMGYKAYSIMSNHNRLLLSKVITTKNEKGGNYLFIRNGKRVLKNLSKHINH